MKEEFLKDFFNFSQENNYVFFNKKSNIVSYSMYCVKKDHPVFDKIEMRTKYTNFQQFLEKFKNCSIYEIIVRPFDKNDFSLFVDFFVKVFEEGKYDKKDLLKNIDCICTTSSSALLEVLERISKNKKEFISFLQMIPISTLAVNNYDSVKMETIDLLLEKYKFSEEESLKFYISFLKTRKNQIKGVNVGPKIRDFLIKKFETKEKLEGFFPFFSFLKDVFVGSEINVSEECSEYVSYTRVNCRKLAQALCIDGFGEGHLESAIKNFMLVIKKFYPNYKEVIVENFDNQKKILEIRVYSDIPVKKEDIEKDIKEFVLFKKQNPNIDLGKEGISIMFSKRELENKLSNTEVKNKKLKM